MLRSLALRAFVVVFCGLTATACTKPSRYTDEGMQRLDDNSTYRITKSEDGFTVLVNHSQYQFMPRRGVVHEACRRALVEAARRNASSVAKDIQPINAQGIFVDSGRNIFDGSTTCTATYDVKWAK